MDILYDTIFVHWTWMEHILKARQSRAKNGDGNRMETVKGPTVEKNAQE